MSFFSKKPATADGALPPERAPATPPDGSQSSYVDPAPAKPINWEALINSPAEQQPAQMPPPAPAQPATPPVEMLPEVDDETRAILDKAAKDLQEKLRGNDDGENNGQ